MRFFGFFGALHVALGMAENALDPKAQQLFASGMEWLWWPGVVVWTGIAVAFFFWKPA